MRMRASPTETVLDGKRNPVDRVAARVTRPGVRFEPGKRIQTADSRNPIQLRPLEGIPFSLRSMVGYAYGRMTVLGLSFATSDAKWVVRCSCGTYTQRAMRAIRNPANNADCCEHCRHLLFLKCRDLHGRGIESAWDELPGVCASRGRLGA